MIDNILTKQILSEIIIFDFLDYPLTILQIQKFLAVEVKVSDLLLALSGEYLSEKIKQKNGFYFLAGQEELVEKRLSRYGISAEKFKKVRRVSRLLGFFPGVRGLALYSSLSLFNAKADSDLDFFIVGAKGHLWSTRFFVNLFLKIFHLRPTPQKSQDGICASYWVDEDALDISVANDSPVDYYYYWGAASFIFIYDQNKVAERFFFANSWLKDFVPAYYPNQVIGKVIIGNFLMAIKRLMEFILFLPSEKFYQNIQLRILPERYKKIQNLDKRVIINR